MSWFDLRNRSPDPNAALLRDLIQAKIDFEIQAHEPEDSEHLEIGVETYSNMNIDDSLSWSYLRDVTLGFTDRNYIPLEPDLNKLRLWIKNENGGHILHDHAKMGNIINIFGNHPPALLKIGDQDGLTGNRLCNLFDGNVARSPVLPAGGQFIRISDNPNIRVQELTSGDSISFFIRLYAVMPPANEDYMVLWSKIDNEQVTDGYIATIDKAGYIYFTVRKANKTRTIKTAQPLTYLMLEEVIASYQVAHFQPQFFKTFTQTLADLDLPDPIPFVDLVVTCKFSDMSMSIIRDGVPIASTAALQGSSLVGHWRLGEGGNIGTTVQEQTPTQRTAFNSSTASGANNGTITGAVWEASPATPYIPYLKFTQASSDKVSITSYTNIQAPTSFTVSCWFYYGTGSQPADYSTLVTKGTVSTANTWWMYVEEPQHQVQFTTWNSSGSRTDAMHPTVLVPGNWYHVVIRLTVGSTKIVYVNGVKFTGNNTTGSTLDTGSGVPLIIGSRDATHAPGGYIHEVKIWNANLTDADVAAIYAEGHPHATFPVWKADPPIPDESPDPITNPFVRYYNVPWDTNAANRDTTKLHARIISGFTNFYDTNDDTDISGSSQTLPYAAIYDVQASGGGTGGTPVTIHDVAIGSGQHLEFESGVTRGGVQLLTGNTGIGKALRSVTVKYRNLGGGTITVGVRKASDGTLVSLGTFTAGGSGEQSVTVNGTPTYAMVANDIISIEGGDGSIELTQNPSASDPANSTSVEYDGSWGASGYPLALTVTAAVPGANGYTIAQPIARPPNADAVNNRVAAAITSASYNQIGKKITKCVFSMSKTGSPGGSILCKIFKNGSTSSTQQIGVAKSAGDIPAVQGNVTFEWSTEAERAAQTYALANGDKIGIEITGFTASATNYYTVHFNETSSLANISAQYYQSVSPSTGWFATSTAYEIIGQFYDGGFTQTLPAIVAHIKLDHATTRAAEKFATSSAAIGKAITRISPRFKKFGNPTGSVSVVIRNNAGTQMTTFGTIDAVADIPAGAVWTLKDFTNLTNARAIAANDIVSIEYGSGDANNYVMVSMNLNHDNYDASLSYAQTWATAGSNYANAGGGTTYDIAGTMATGGIATDPLGRTRAGQRINAPASVMRGKKVTRAILWLSKVGTAHAASTPVNIRIRKEGTDAIAAEIGSIMATALTTTPTAYTFENVNNVYVMQQNDILSVEYDYSDDSNYVVFNRSKTDIFEATGNLSQVVDFNAPSYAVLASDMYGELWTGGDTYTPAVDEQTIRDPFYHHDLLIGAGGADWSYYAAVGTIGNHAGIHIIPEFRLYRQELTAQQALNLFTNRCTISNIPFGKVAKVGTFGVAST